MGRMKMNTVDHFMSETAVHYEQYNDGLINKGMFVCQCMANLTTLMEKDLQGAQRIIEGYGWSGNDFTTWMHKQAGKE